MGLVQIFMIWGALSGALFPFPSQAGEWEEYRLLKDAMVRSSAKRDLPLPPWAAGLDYRRAEHWFPLGKLPVVPIDTPKEKHDAKASFPAPVAFSE